MPISVGKSNFTKLNNTVMKLGDIRHRDNLVNMNVSKVVDDERKRYLLLL